MNSLIRNNSASRPSMAVTRSESEKIKFCQRLISQLAQKHTHQFYIILPDDDDDKASRPVVIRATISKSKRTNFEQSLFKISQHMSDKYEIKVRSSDEDQPFSIDPTVSHSVSNSLIDASLSSSYIVNKSARVKKTVQTLSESSSDMIELTRKQAAPRIYKFHKSFNLD
ncbi:hypothetical protein BpHYR1_009279 [Brachionus plicatilis]|uniref:Uncharacterized protein n=1 Tax=Brachionus plicatilis TaxID=10195 RepID=A0A3M7QBZ1_BRAPC|nr:hypothetical protein BpHYR1_009279 [Brachionus plicatilis]